ncbi:MAG: NapC/NirT family cytochrome c [Anaerolineaceae bacterium]
MKDILHRLDRFRFIPYLIGGLAVLVLMIAASAAWEYTNQTTFCGLTCHTMPPQYITHQNSPHARVTCEDCHLGRVPLAEAIPRKAKYSYGTGSAMILNNYEYPIRAKSMRPARDVCETCHFPGLFSSDSLVEIKNFANDTNNTLNTTHIILKTGGGTIREGLASGIHWHIENPIYFVALDPERQEIPYVRVDLPDGSKKEYVDVESGFDVNSIKDSDLQKMDCISCHNRTAHPIKQPEEYVDQLLSQKLVSIKIPDIHEKALEVLKADYASMAEAETGIRALSDYYQKEYADFYAVDKPLLDKAVDEIWSVYQRSTFVEQKMDADTHPDNAQHQSSPGCFRCHDGKHLTANTEAIRLECNLCHSIPIVTGPDEFTTTIELSNGPEPEMHRNTNWIMLHQDSIDATCATCHSMDDPGGVSNRSFCSNSACHGSKYTYAGFDAPAVRDLLEDALQPTPVPSKEPPAQAAETNDEEASVEDVASTPSGKITYKGNISAVLQKCTSCHGESGMKGVILMDYATIMAGSPEGPLVVPGDSKASLILSVLTGSKPHFAQLTQGELKMLAGWIDAGAKEK